MDRDLKFDIVQKLVNLQPGEEDIDFIPNIEDTKGKIGEKGDIRITNLRFLWISKDKPNTNLSLGLNCIKDLFIRNANSVIKGTTQSLYVVCKHEGSKYEFVFTNLGDDTPRLFSTTQAILRAYETSRQYRDLKLRGSIIKDGDLKLLKGEKVISKVSGVWNVSNTQGHLGTLHTTNLRIVWHANATPNFNVSIPYLMLLSVQVRPGKTGESLVVETNKFANSYILGFRIEPTDRMNKLAVEIRKLSDLFWERPLYGLEYVPEPEAKARSEAAVQSSNRGGGGEDGEPAEESENGEAPAENFQTEGGDSGVADVMKKFYAEVAAQGDRPPVYNVDLGLAVEGLPDGFTIPIIWNDLLDVMNKSGLNE